MVNDIFVQQVRQNLPYQPNPSQEELLYRLAGFVLGPETDSLFLLTGYAGTGKTSLIGGVVRTLSSLSFKMVLLAPTGRAAKVFAGYAGQQAFTIHKKIYRQRSFSPDMEGFLITENLHKDTLFIVDEASMIANDSADSTVYGTGHLLDDLIEYVYSGERCRLLLLGDTAQLPPVGREESPALERDLLSGYGLRVMGYELDKVARQTSESGILFNATRLREMMTCRPLPVPKLRFAPFRDVTALNGEELVEKISEAYDRDGIDETIIITRSNKRANIFNRGVRNQILYREEELSSGDLLLIARNNYFWGKEHKEIGFIANGDVARVERVRRVTEMYGFRFADVLLWFPYLEAEIEAKIILDTLTSESPALTREQGNDLFMRILEDYEDLSSKREKMKRLKEDPWFNALQVKFAYGMTCHKAQGGQWKTAFIDMGYIDPSAVGLDFYRWLYTALTRATGRVYIINPSESFQEKK